MLESVNFADFVGISGKADWPNVKKKTFPVSRESLET